MGVIVVISENDGNIDMSIMEIMLDTHRTQMGYQTEEQEELIGS